MGTGPTEVESFLIREFIMLPHLIRMLENNIKKMKEDGLGRPLQELYFGATRAMILNIESDLTEVRKALRTSNIKVWEG